MSDRRQAELLLLSAEAPDSVLRQSRVSRRRYGTASFDRPHGYTLIEVMLVLALLAGISAVIWPALQKPFATRRLSSAADTVRTQWSHARVEAMRSGHTYTFRFAVNGDHFRVAKDTPAGPAAPAASSVEAKETITTDCVEDGGAMPADIAVPPDDKILPEGIKFSSGEPTDAAPGATDDFATQSSSDMTDCWSDPIFFYPDGTTSDARLMLINDYRSVIELVLRGLTGTVTVSEPVSSVE